jgi:group I intron endonuclease
VILQKTGLVHVIGVVNFGNMGQIYCITNLVNGNKYIGQNKTSNPKYLGSGKLIKQAVKKYGRDSFTKTILWEGPNEHINDMEEYWIEYFSATTSNIFYNIASSAFPPVLSGELNGFYGKKHSDATKDKLRNIRKLQKNVNYEVGLKMMHSKSSIEKRASTYKKKYLNGEIVHWSKGQTKDTNKILLEIGKKISKIQKGRPSKSKKEILCIELNQIFESLTDAAKKLNLSQGDISNVLCGRQKTTKGFTFKYN